MNTVRSIWAWGITLALAAVFVSAMAVVIVPTLGWGRPFVAGPAIGLWGRLSLRLAGIRLKVTGAEHLRGRRPRVVICNHSSALDIVCMAALAPPAPTAVAKRELIWTPFINLGFWLVGTVWVDRSTPASALESLRRAALRVKSERLSLMISPEGTRARDGQLASFKSGAFHVAQQANADIVPVVLRDVYRLCPPTGWHVHPGVVHVEVKPPIPPSDDPKAQAAQVHGLYRGWLAECTRTS